MLATTAVLRPYVQHRVPELDRLDRDLSDVVNTMFIRARSPTVSEAC